jgi:hypothetical protein
MDGYRYGLDFNNKELIMTNQKNDHGNDKAQQNQAGKEQHQPKPGQQSAQQQGQHGQQGKTGEAAANADPKPNQENKNNVNKNDDQSSNKR